MERLQSVARRLAARDNISLATLSIFFVGALLISALAFRTYSFKMQEENLEFWRQMDIFFVISEVAVIFLAVLKGMELQYYFRRLDIFSKVAVILFLTTFWIGTVFVSRTPEIAYGILIEWLIHMLFGVAVYHCIGEVEERSVAHMAAILSCGLLLLVPIIAWHFLLPPTNLPDMDTSFGWGLAIPGFISGRLLGAFCGGVLAMLVGVAWLSANAGRIGWWHYLAVTLAAGLVIWSGTRAAVLGLVVAVAVAIGIVRGRIKIGFMLAMSGCLIVAGLIATSLIPHGDPYFVLFETKDMANGNAASGGRLSLWRSMLQILAQHPWFGAGAGASTWLIPSGTFPHIQPHNLILQFVLSWGIIAAIPAIFLLARITWRVHGIVTAEPRLLGLIMMLDAFLVMGLLDGMFHFARFIAIIFSCYAAILAASRSPDRSAVKPIFA